MNRIPNALALYDSIESDNIKKLQELLQDGDGDI